eukprot:jgi/Mesen1/7235/ME000373S06308
MDFGNKVELRSCSWLAAISLILQVVILLTSTGVEAWDSSRGDQGSARWLQESTGSAKLPDEGIAGAHGGEHTGRVELKGGPLGSATASHERVAAQETDRWPVGVVSQAGDEDRERNWRSKQSAARTSGGDGKNSTRGSNPASFRKLLQDRGAGGSEGEGDGDGEGDDCKGRYIYIYDLPPKFNQELLDDCENLNPYFSRCAQLSNDGLGVLMKPEEEGHMPGGRSDGLPPIRGLGASGVPKRSRDGVCWYETEQFSIEVLVHQYMMQYECVTADPDQAAAFYLPFYPGLEAEKYIFDGAHAKEDQLASELAALLRASPMWQRHQGMDHFYVIGRVTWDFRKGLNGAQWGIPLLKHPELNTLRIGFERAPGDPREFAIPYPTAFHPKTDRQLAAWLAAVRRRRAVHRASFLGGRRDSKAAPALIQEAGRLRATLMQQCSQAPADCHLVVCEHSSVSICARSSAVLRVLLSSEFCLQPPGDTPTRKSVFDSLLTGCIPVFFDPWTAHKQYTWHLPPDPDSYSVFIPREAIMSGSANVISVLRSYSAEKIARMRETILDIIPGIVYARGQLEEEDATDVTIRSLLRHISRVKKGLEVW